MAQLIIRCKNVKNQFADYGVKAQTINDVSLDAEIVYIILDDGRVLNTRTVKFDEDNELIVNASPYEEFILKINSAEMIKSLDVCAPVGTKVKFESDNDLPELANAFNLESIKLTNIYLDAGFVARNFNRLNLKNVDIVPAANSAIMLKEFSDLTALKVLRLAESHTAHNTISGVLSSLSNLKELAVLELESRLIHGNLNDLNNLSRLKSVSLVDCYLEHAKGKEEFYYSYSRRDASM